MRAIIYADDVSPVTASPPEMNAVLKSISIAGTFNSYKFKPSKCKVLGSGLHHQKEYTLGGRSIEWADFGLLLGVVVDGRSIFAREHIKRRAKMVGTAITQIKSWRTKGLPFKIAFQHLFLAKVVPRFTYGFSLIPSEEGRVNLELIQRTLGKP